MDSTPRFISKICRIIICLIIAALTAIFLVWSFGERITIEGYSMIDRLHNEDVVLVNKLAYKISSIDRFDIVSFNYSTNKRSVKRVVGLPGEKVRIKNGIVYINGRKLDMPEGIGEYAVAGLAEKTLELGADEYFILGDNNDNSEDSRFPVVGNVSSKNIEGKVWLRISPLSDFGFIKSGVN